MIAAFLAGLVYEGICTAWVRWVADSHAVLAGVAAMTCASAVVIGLGEARKGHRNAAAYVLGCGVGACIVVWMGAP